MFKKIQEYFADVVVEMQKVSWPTRPEVVESTVIVFALSVTMAIAVFGVDQILTYGLKFVL
ncbi:preprotein translocase subunit SecE [bacterium]|jgi:preprotein translocase subunit SecE|nr:preprotein translocase subunit SecE [bacterium]